MNFSKTTTTTKTNNNNQKSGKENKLRKRKDNNRFPKLLSVLIDLKEGRVEFCYSHNYNE